MISEFSSFSEVSQTFVSRNTSFHSYSFLKYFEITGFLKIIITTFGIIFTIEIIMQYNVYDEC